MSGNNKKPILVILAAGMGSRYGGLKQMDKIGSGGETLLDYSVFDALRSGFGKVIFIIRRDIEADFRGIVLARLENKVPFELAFQEQDSLIPAGIAAHAKTAGRTKPWGTVHALLCAADLIDGPFCVINADDFYGRKAYEVMGEYLSGGDVTDGAFVPYRLEDTLSELGPVSRGVCGIENGFLARIGEMKSLERIGADVIVNRFEDGSTLEFTGGEPVSMNFWGFPPTIMCHFTAYFEDFLSAQGRELKSECYLPLAADSFVKNSVIKIRALEECAGWFGVTYKDDRDMARKRIEKLTAEGVYPQRLWE
jgi:hypothetical protein